MKLPSWQIQHADKPIQQRKAAFMWIRDVSVNEASLRYIKIMKLFRSMILFNECFFDLLWFEDVSSVGSPFFSAWKLCQVPMAVCLYAVEPYGGGSVV